MKYKTITWETLSNLCPGEKDYFEGWRLIEEKQTGTWRWGYINRYILQQESDGKYFELRVQIASGDNGPGFSCSEEFEMDYEVAPVPVEVTEWVRK